MGMKQNSLPSLLLSSRKGSADPDADLLTRFVVDRDQTAFAELVHRYARLVWRVARTRCRNDATAEDVFQAAFVVLSRKAGSIRSGDALAGWLHRTAHRLAVKATQKERPVDPLPAQLSTFADPLDALSARELLAAVDDELAKLSDAERSVLVLCGIDGLANDEAAKWLGTSTGSVKGRLERARAKLRTRLDARGLVLPTLVLGLIGNIPPASAVQTALKIPCLGPVSFAIEQLIHEGLTMKLTITKAGAMLALCAVIATVGGWSGEVASQPKVNAAPVPKLTTKPLWSEPVKVDWKGSGAERINGVWAPDGKNVLVPAPTLNEKGQPIAGGGIDFLDTMTGKVTHSRKMESSDTISFQATSISIAADGNQIVATGTLHEIDTKTSAKGGVYVWRDAGDESPKLLKGPQNSAFDDFSGVAVSPDGTRVTSSTPSSLAYVHELSTLNLLGSSEMHSAKGTLRSAPAYHPSGNYTVVATTAGEVYLNANGDKPNPNVQAGPRFGRLDGCDAKFRTVTVSPNGKLVAAGGASGTKGQSLAVIDDCDESRLGKEFRVIADTVPAKQSINGLAFSHDSKHLATACSDGVLRIFDVKTGKLAASVKEHQEEIFSVAYSPDGKKLLTVGRDAVKIWDVAQVMAPK